MKPVADDSANLNEKPNSHVNWKFIGGQDIDLSDSDSEETNSDYDCEDFSHASPGPFVECHTQVK